jgi:hypothetical protein
MIYYTILYYTRKTTTGEAIVERLKMMHYEDYRLVLGLLEKCFYM